MTTVKYPAGSGFYELDNFDEIVEQATLDQQTGLNPMRGRRIYETVAEKTHYVNAWGDSLKQNGIPAAFIR